MSPVYVLLERELWQSCEIKVCISNLLKKKNKCTTTIQPVLLRPTSVFGLAHKELVGKLTIRQCDRRNSRGINKKPWGIKKKKINFE